MIHAKLAALTLALTAATQGSTFARSLDVAFPFDARSVTAQEIDLTPRLGEILALGTETNVRMRDVRLPTGDSVNLELRRIDLEAMSFGIRVNGEPRPDALANLQLSVWRGEVEGDAGSEVVLSFSAYGSRGWIRHGNELIHLLATPGPGGGWTDSESIFTTERRLNQRGLALGEFCSSDELPSYDPAKLSSIPPPSYLGSPDLLLQCSIAVETDWQLYQQFGNLNAEMAYVTTLLAAVSDRYVEEINVVLTYPYLQFYDNPSDPWTTQETPGADAGDLLSEFRSAWANNIPLNSRLAHFVSGDSLGGGIASLGVVCNPAFGFGVSSGVSGNTSFPVSQGFGNWDFVVIAHELGHNFSSIHTHDFCPAPLDNCAPSNYFGSCQTSQTCSNQGTLMSYCHLCGSGISNITTFFHPTVKNRMRNYAEGTCLPVVNPPPENYCVGKLSTDFCLPFITWTGGASVSDTGTFNIRANDVVANQNGLFIYGVNGRGNIPFHNAKLCVKAPLVRMLPPKSTGSGSGPCPGFMKVNFNKRIQAGTDPMLTLGQVVNGQWLYRDPGIDPFNDGLSNGIEFKINP